MRFRLRFLLQEIDLGPGVTTIGRSAACQITIDDPLVSREHARIRVDGPKVTLEDLGSRNGLSVNGKPTKGIVELVDGDRLRVGSQELVLCVLGGASAATAEKALKRTTGFMCHCADCGIPYPAESPACPACGSTVRSQDDTLSGARSDRDWSLELASEAVGRALDKQSWEDVERLLLRARLHVEQRLADGGRIDQQPLHGIADAAVALATATGELTWVRWALSLYATLGQMPPSTLAKGISSFPPAVRDSLAPAVRRVVETVTEKGGPAPEDRESYDQLVVLSRDA
ncbi:MAG TPA: FHA domain-containing protein [Polyangiaceae bacterium]|nr:FHA domain-containing protein [Polyangiaceae bacterium]